MPKSDLNKVAKQITRQHECHPVNLLHIFRATFPKNNSGGLLLQEVGPLVSVKRNKYFLRNFES